MLKYIVKRLLISVIILLGVSVIIYALVRCMPTDYIDIKFADAAMTNEGVAERIQEFKEMYGIADNSFGGILKGYFSWIGNLFKGDFGTSFIHEVPVTQVIAEHMWISFGIALVAVILQFLIAIPLGITSATHQYSARDYSVTVFTMIGLSLPTYFFAAICIKLFSVELGWFPATGQVNPQEIYPETFAGAMQKFGDLLHCMILPISVSVIL